jgi:HAMP domain-containing protein
MGPFNDRGGEGVTPMKIALKFNLALLLVFALTLSATYVVGGRLLELNGRANVQENARIMMQSALAIRTYTETQIKPLLDGQNHYRFLPQTVPSYSATEYFGSLAANPDLRDYAYKEATLNPTNPRDRAVDWEVDVVGRFRRHPDLKEIVGERDGAFGKSLYLARPLQIADPACLSCHGTVSTAPATMIDLYGPANGFGWKPEEIVGAQIVSVPQSVALERADAIVSKILYLLAGLFVVLFVALNFLLSTLILRPIKKLGTIADQVSLGEMDAPEFPARGGDEMAALGQSFNRMRRSLVEAINLLQ